MGNWKIQNLEDVLEYFWTWLKSARQPLENQTIMEETNILMDKYSEYCILQQQ